MEATTMGRGTNHDEALRLHGAHSAHGAHGTYEAQDAQVMHHALGARRAWRARRA